MMTKAIMSQLVTLVWTLVRIHLHVLSACDDRAGTRPLRLATSMNTVHVCMTLCALLPSEGLGATLPKRSNARSKKSPQSSLDTLNESLSVDCCE